MPALNVTKPIVATDHPILLFDGVCGLCQGTVQFLLRRDHQAIFRFASIQSVFAQSILARHPDSPKDLSTLIVVLDQGTETETLLFKSNALLHLVSCLGGMWRVFGVFKFMPPMIRDLVYDFVARNRYAWFGQTESCMVPTQEMKSRFLDITTPQ